MAVKRKTIHNLVMREIFVSCAGELSHAGDRPKYREPPAQVVRVNRYAYRDITITGDGLQKFGLCTVIGRREESLYGVIPAMTWDLGLHDLLQRTALFRCLSTSQSALKTLSKLDPIRI